MSLEKMRNIGIMAHIDAGKTTTTERILYYSGKIHKIGEIDDGAATMDFMKQEQERGITIGSAAITTEWNGHQINIIDTPGHVDFTAEVERSLRVLDGAVAVICAVGHVQPQTETVWKQADEFNVPRICFVNKMDRTGADFFGAVEDVKKKFGCETVAMQIPLGQGSDFDGIIDLLEMKEIHWDAATEGEKFTVSEISENNRELASQWREKLIDTVASNDDELGEIYLEGGEISNAQLKAAVRKATISRTLVPFFCGTARRNQGIQPLMDAIIDYLPSPEEIPPAEGVHVKKNAEEKVSVPCDVNAKAPVGLVFKIQYDPQMGMLCYVRMYAGKISTGTMIYNAGKKKRERVNRILRVNANHMEQMDSVSAGDIAVFVGFKLAQTGDSIGSEGFPVLLESVKFPEPVISVAIEPETMSDRDKLMETLDVLSHEDPTFTFRDDSETGQLVISGMGELHLDVLVTRIRDDFKVQCRVGAPQVTYRESISSSCDYAEEYSRTLAGKDVTASIKIHVEPAANGEGNSYVCNVKKQADVPDEIYDAVEHSITSCFGGGIKYGYPCADVKVSLEDLKYSPETSTTFAFEAAAAEAFDNACNQAQPLMLEPVMAVDIESPTEFVGDAMSALTQRGGIINSMEDKADSSVIHAEAPMVKMFGFTTALRSVTQGRASFGMTFAHFQAKA
ncbi:elongation factor G [Treponema sp.]|uniref:elongation factor G n=1 Tax=Treponema sp. TaxID=166 RepID=UPI00257AE93B|nr:elongation factor G [Treponema sp.]MBE6354551.1 elongation factor G [Treponema sp.]